jgi:DNA-binding HxlR family transcriptional regulator
MPRSQGPPRAAARTGGSAAGALAAAADVVGDRWSLLVVSRLLTGPRRFGELLDELDGLAPNILAKRLSRLEGDGLVVGEPYTTRPVRHAYRLTAAGAELAGALRLLAAWGAGSAGPAHGPAHGRCGTTLDVRWFCATCDEVVAEPVPAEAPGDDEPDLIWV